MCDSTNERRMSGTEGSSHEQHKRRGYINEGILISDGVCIFAIDFSVFTIMHCISGRSIPNENHAFSRGSNLQHWLDSVGLKVEDRHRTETLKSF